MGTVQPKMSSAKAITAGVMTSLTAVMTCLATVQVVLDDDKVDISEYATVAGAVASLVATVYAVWKVPNRPLEPPRGLRMRPDGQLSPYDDV